MLAHGLLGFDELKLAGQNLPGVEYWRGIREALHAKGIEVITCTVPPSGSIEVRAAKLAENIAAKANGKSVNIIGYGVCVALCRDSRAKQIHADIAWYDCQRTFQIMTDYGRGPHTTFDKLLAALTMQVKRTRCTLHD